MRRTLDSMIAALLVVALAAPAGAQALNPTEPPIPKLAAGERIPAFETKGLLDNTTQRVSLSAPVTVLLFFLSSCQVCHGMIPEWNRAYTRRDKNVEVWGVILDSPPPAFFQQMDIKFPVLRVPSNYREVYKVHRVPQTIRVGKGGVVEDISVGPIDALRVGELFRPPDPPPAKSSKRKAN